MPFHQPRRFPWGLLRVGCLLLDVIMVTFFWGLHPNTTPVTANSMPVATATPHSDYQWHGRSGECDRAAQRRCLGSG